MLPGKDSSSAWREAGLAGLGPRPQHHCRAGEGDLFLPPMHCLFTLFSPTGSVGASVAAWECCARRKASARALRVKCAGKRAIGQCKHGAR